MWTITISPLGDGWAVAAPGLAFPMLFHKKGDAEDAARRLARGLTPIDVEIRLRQTAPHSRLHSV